LKSSIFIDFQSRFPQDSLLKKIFACGGLKSGT